MESHRHSVYRHRRLEIGERPLNSVQKCAVEVFAAAEIAVPWVMLGSAEQHLLDELVRMADEETK